MASLVKKELKFISYILSLFPKLFFLYKSCKILLNKKKNRSIENILNDIIIKEIDDKNDSIYNNFCLKFKNKYKEKVLLKQIIIL